MLLTALALIVWSLAGCGTPPPCNVEPAQVEQARADLQASEAVAAESAAQIDELEAQIEALRGQVVSAEEKAELEQRLEELKKGSGR